MAAAISASNLDSYVDLYRRILPDIAADNLNKPQALKLFVKRAAEAGFPTIDLMRLRPHNLDPLHLRVTSSRKWVTTKNRIVAGRWVRQNVKKFLSLNSDVNNVAAELKRDAGISVKRETLIEIGARARLWDRQGNAINMAIAYKTSKRSNVPIIKCTRISIPDRELIDRVGRLEARLAILATDVNRLAAGALSNQLPASEPSSSTATVSPPRTRPASWFGVESSPVGGT